MPGLDVWLENSMPESSFSTSSNSDLTLFISGGLFLEPSVSSSLVRFLPSIGISSSVAHRRTKSIKVDNKGVFSSVSLRNVATVQNPGFPIQNGAELAPVQNGSSMAGVRDKSEVKLRERGRGRGAMNTTKHLWAGAISAMVSRTCLAPLERLKLEYMVRGEQKHLFELIGTIARTQGLKGFWQGNFVNMLRTAPFKAINFYSFDTYRKQLLRLTGNEETTNFERLIAGAAAGMTATILCLPLDTIRTKMVAHGGEALGGVIGTFQHMIQTQGFWSLYKGLVPSLLSIAPSAAVFYSVYDVLKSSYLQSPEGRKRLQNMKQQGQVLNALNQLELGPLRTLLYGAISGACAEAVTYPFEVVRRKLQLQVKITKLSALGTFVNIIEQGGISALYAGLTPSLLQVLPSAAISFFVYEFTKVVLKVE